MKEEDAKLFWERLRIQQIKTGAKTLKTLCKEMEVPYQTLVNQKHANRYPAIPVVIALSKALNCSIDWLLTGEDFNKASYSEKLQKLIDALKSLD